jgi:transposase InsO family protein
LEDYGQLPPELQQQVVCEVEQARTRSNMRVDDALSHLGIARSNYFRWKKEAGWKNIRKEPIPPVQAFEALAEEKAAVMKFALNHPEIRHRELSWRMIDEDVAYLSSSTVYRILRDARLVHCRPGRKKRYRDEIEKANGPDDIWATDLMYLTIGGAQYYLVNFIDEYSRYLVHWELLTSMDGHSISVAAQRALETLPRNASGEVVTKPIIRSDNGSGYISQEFGGLLAHHELTHHRIKPHCPEENGVMERCHRTLREAIEEHDLIGRYDSEKVIGELVKHYNEVRLHSALLFQTPATWYRGNPSQVSEARRRKLAQARHRRKQFNLGIRQRTFPFSAAESATNN